MPHLLNLLRDGDSATALDTCLAHPGDIPGLGNLSLLQQLYFLGLPQVNITLLDINDNYPTWKDEPYFINLVEMTPPNSDVTTVRVGQGDGSTEGLAGLKGVTSKGVSPPKCGIICVTSSPAPSCRILFESLPLCFFSLMGVFFTSPPQIV